jgi:hypothetical protein
MSVAPKDVYRPHTRYRQMRAINIGSRRNTRKTAIQAIVSQLLERYNAWLMENNNLREIGEWVEVTILDPDRHNHRLISPLFVHIFVEIGLGQKATKFKKLGRPRRTEQLTTSTSIDK